MPAPGSTACRRRSRQLCQFALTFSLSSARRQCCRVALIGAACSGCPHPTSGLRGLTPPTGTSGRQTQSARLRDESNNLDDAPHLPGPVSPIRARKVKMEAVITTEDLRKSFRGPETNRRSGPRRQLRGRPRRRSSASSGTERSRQDDDASDAHDAVTHRLGDGEGGRLRRRARPKQVRQRIGYVSQAGGADDLSTGWENLILQGRLYGGDLDSVRQRAKQLAAVLTSPNSPAPSSRARHRPPRRQTTARSRAQRPLACRRPPSSGWINQRCSRR